MAKFHWRGAATAVPRKYTATIADVWATGDTASLKIGSASLTITAGTAVTTADIAAALNAAINGTTTTPGIIGTETRNANGQAIPQFAQVSSTVSGSVVTITGTPGVDLTMTASEVTAGTGTVTLASIQTPTGPNFMDNPDNYLEGVLPGSNDTIICDWGTQGILYKLDFLQANTLSINVDFTGDFRGEVGLPAINATWGYAEYLPRFLDMYGTTAGRMIRFLPGSQDYTDHKPIRIDLQDVTLIGIQSTHSRGSVADYGKPNVFIYGGGDGSSGLLGDVSLQKGQFHIDYPDSNLLANRGFTPASLAIGAAGNEDKECTVIFGESCRLYKITSNVIEIAGADVTFNCATSFAGDDTATELRGGTLTIDSATSDYLTVKAHDGTTLFVNNALTMGTINLYGATLNTDGGSPACTLSNVKVYPGSALYDKRGVCITEFDLVGCGLSDVTLGLGSNKKYTLGTATA